MSDGLRIVISLFLFAMMTAALQAGGWAVVTVRRMPSAMDVGQSVTVTYAVRVHGRTLMPGLQGHVEAHLDGTIVKADSTPLSTDGHYAATLLLPRAGTWTLDITSGYPNGSGRALLHVVERGQPAPVLPAASRGRELFVSKGCAACHTQWPWLAPRLQPAGYAPEVLTRLLSNGSQPIDREFGMPNLELDAAEIADIVAFLNVRGSR